MLEHVLYKPSAVSHGVLHLSVPWSNTSRWDKEHTRKNNTWLRPGFFHVRCCLYSVTQHWNPSHRLQEGPDPCSKSHFNPREVVFFSCTDSTLKEKQAQLGTSQGLWKQGSFHSKESCKLLLCNSDGNCNLLTVLSNFSLLYLRFYPF